MLETFCNSHNIKLIWSTWSNALSAEDEDFLKNKFKNYIKDPTRPQFPREFEWVIPMVDDVELLKPYYQMIDWDSCQCHKEYSEKYEEIFDMGYDYHKIPGSWGPGSHRPHPGIHRQIHWSEFYYNELNKRGWLK